MLTSTEVFNRDTSLQSAEYAPPVFYSCKDFTGTVDRREWGGNVCPRNSAEKALNCSPEPRSCKSRQKAKETLTLAYRAPKPRLATITGLAYASLIICTKLA